MSPRPQIVDLARVSRLKWPLVTRGSLADQPLAIGNVTVNVEP
ncbi:MAG: hypothetical protein U0075_08565 [Thermomicrobiales bacterium]